MERSYAGSTESVSRMRWSTWAIPVKMAEDSLRLSGVHIVRHLKIVQRRPKCIEEQIQAKVQGYGIWEVFCMVILPSSFKLGHDEPSGIGCRQTTERFRVRGLTSNQQFIRLSLVSNMCSRYSLQDQFPRVVRISSC